MILLDHLIYLVHLLFAVFLLSIFRLLGHLTHIVLLEPQVVLLLLVCHHTALEGCPLARDFGRARLYKLQCLRDIDGLSRHFGTSAGAPASSISSLLF